MIILQPGEGGNCFPPKSNWMQAASNSPPVAGPDNDQPFTTKRENISKQGCLLGLIEGRPSANVCYAGVSVLGRPTYCTCWRTYVLPWILSYFCRLISELAERNSTKICHMVEIKCNLKTHVQNLEYRPQQLGDRKTTFLDDFAT